MVACDERDLAKVAGVAWTLVDGVVVGVVDGWVRTPAYYIWRVTAKSVHLNGDPWDFRRSNIHLLWEDGSLVGTAFDQTLKVWRARWTMNRRNVNFGSNKDPLVAHKKFIEMKPDAVAPVGGTKRVPREFPAEYPGDRWR